MLKREQIVESKYKPKERELELRTPEELVDDWTKAIEGDVERPLTTCFPKIDKDLRNKLRGTVGAYIGKGGTKKSLAALQACRQNVLAHENNCTSVYVNMEMAIFQWLSRLIDMSFTVEDHVYNSSWYYERNYTQSFKTMKSDVREEITRVLKDNLRKLYGNNLYVNSQTGLSIDDLNTLVKNAIKKNGKLDMLVIDGLSMMDGKGNETESYTTNSKELKDLAKMYNIFIPLICHVTKMATKHTRDLQEFIRGSEKILDNVDFQIMFSLLIDEVRSGETIEYLNDKGYIRFYNKRGSGNTINLIYEFDSAKLQMTETDNDPMLFEVTKKKKEIF
jgi:hypothetical protein